MGPFNKLIPRLITRARPSVLSYSRFFRGYSSSLLNGNKSGLFNPQLFSDEKATIVDNNCPNIFSHRTDQLLTISRISSHPVPQLPLLKDMVRMIKKNLDLGDLQDVVIVGAQHILETTVSFFKALIDIGIPPQNIWMIGKIYSTSVPVAMAARELGINLMDDAMPETPDGYQKANRAAINSMWDRLRLFIKGKNIKRIIVVDDGGRVIDATPEDFRVNFRMAVLEQTRGGLYSSGVQEFLGPVISVAQSAVKKKFLEPLMIAKALFRTEKAIQALGIDHKTVCGVVGNGAIGGALADYLLKKGVAIVVYDPNPNAFQELRGKKLCRVSSIEKVIANSRVIFGGAGRDITQSLSIEDIFSLTRDKIFVSTTSEQNEFLTLLKAMTMILQRDQTITSFNPLGDIVCTNSNGRSITVKNMGYPFNFPIRDSKGNWIQPWNVPAHHIQNTQCMMLGGTVQAIHSATLPIFDGITINNPRILALDPFIQRSCALPFWERYGHEFRDLYSFDKAKLFKNIPWIIENSGGEYIEYLALKRCFESVSQSSEKNHAVVEEIKDAKENSTYSHGL